MNTVHMLMLKYDSLPIIDSGTVAKDFFRLSIGKFHEKIRSGEIPLPLIMMEEHSQKCAKGVHLNDLADYLDDRQAAASKQMNAIYG